MKNKLFCIITICFLNKNVFSECINPEGEQVDWYIIFLMQNRFGKFSYSDNTHNLQTYDSTPALFPPLKQAVELNSGIFNYVIWNDDDIHEIKRKGHTKTHSKGILAYNENNGHYIIHSLPKFPYHKDGKFHHDFPPNMGKYVQTFICVSLDHENLIKLSWNLKAIYPNIHESKTDLIGASELTQNLERLLSRKRAKKDPLNIELYSLQGQLFNVFLKPRGHKILPWDHEIPEFYKQTFEVATWTRPKVLDDDCEGDYDTIKVLRIKIDGMMYTINQDHSKWGVSKDIVCIGDLNRTPSQLKSSGGVLCFKNQKEAKRLNNIIILSSHNCDDKNNEINRSNLLTNQEKSLKFLE